MRAGPGVAAAALSGRRVVIVGGGVAGASLAWAASRAGAAVTLLEAGRIGAQGGSSLPVALVNPHRGRSGRARAADAAGASALWRWADALGDAGHATGAVRGGVVRPARDERQRRAWRRLDGVRHLPAGDLGPYRLPFGGFLVEGGGWLEPSAWLAAIASAAVSSGAAVEEATRAERIEASSPHRVVTSAGAFVADFVAICIGASEPLELPAVPVGRVAGDVVLTPHETPPHALAGGVYAAPARPAPGSRGEPLLAVGGNHGRGADPAATAGDARRLLASLRRWLPDVSDEVRGLWSGVRARVDDGEPVVRELAGGVWWVGAFAGRGFIRAASTAEALVARWSRSG